ncbi:MAG: hypothetical protein QOH70_2045 [Blastocatellia bacterium]|jgi:hypothetical protein|nr:hypothetical protein [Blastocatellia bacterium]
MTEMIEISVKGLADFMTANPARQRSILRDFKHPDLDEARAKIHYYREARDMGVVFHKGKHDRIWLMNQAAMLLGRATGSSAGAQKRLKNNARALTAYATNFGAKEFEVLPRLKWKLTHSGVQISIQPDLHVRETGKEKVVKLEFSVEEPEPRTAKILHVSVGGFAGAYRVSARKFT